MRSGVCNRPVPDRVCPIRGAALRASALTVEAARSPLGCRWPPHRSPESARLDALVVGTVADLLWSLSIRLRRDVVVRPDARDACTPATFGTGAARSERSPLARARPLRRRSPPRALIIDEGKRRPRHADRPFSPRSRASWAAAELAARAAAPAPLSAAKPRRRDARRASRKCYVSAPPCRARWSSPRRPSVSARVRSEWCVYKERNTPRPRREAPTPTRHSSTIYNKNRGHARGGGGSVQGRGVLLAASSGAPRCRRGRGPPARTLGRRGLDQRALHGGAET